MNRPKLFEIPVSYAAQKRKEGGVIVITMSENQWDYLLQGAYDAGVILLEVDSEEKVIHAYQKGGEDEEV